MTRRELNRLVKKWVDRLGLRDWNIEIEFADELTLSDQKGKESDLWGLCEYDTPTHKATISILDLRHAEWKQSDPEFVLVHELGHLVVVQFGIFDNHDLDPQIEEDLINYITRLAISLDRRPTS